MPFKWSVTPEQAFGDLADDYNTAVNNAVYALAQRYEPEIEAWMKSNASWTDRTGNARQTLHAKAAQDLAYDLVAIFFRHGMEYGKYLELSNGGRYAIIGPALDHFGPKIWADVQALFK